MSHDSKRRRTEDPQDAGVESGSSSSPSSSSSRPSNPHLADLRVDIMYHLGLDTSMDLEKMFGDVKFVCLGGTKERMLEFAQTALVFLGLQNSIPVGCGLTPVGKTERYFLYKVGPILSVTHGMGMPSMKILLHEIGKLLYYAKATNYSFIRIGTCGGIGIPPGSVILSTEVLDAQLKNHHKARVLGKAHKIPTLLDPQLTEGLFQHAHDFNVVKGRTLSANDFYEEQGRMDGYTCAFSAEERLEYLKRCQEAGVVAMEMEAGVFSSFCYEAKIPAAVVCSSLVNRLEGDQVTASSKELAAFADRSIHVVLRFIKSRLEELAAQK